MSLFDEQFEIFHGVSVLYRENPVIFFEKIDIRKMRQTERSEGQVTDRGRKHEEP